jgi:hypothetical protein
MVAAPQGHPFQLHAQHGAGEAGNASSSSFLQLLADAHGQRILPGQAQRLPRHRRLRRGLAGTSSHW